MSTNHATPDRIALTGLSARGYHGLLPFERTEGQLFTADVTVFLGDRGTAVAAVTDSVTDAVNYVDVARAVVGVIEGAPVGLIETLAERISDAVLAFPRVSAVEVTVHKPQAPLDVAFDDVSVTISRNVDAAADAAVNAAAPAAQSSPVAESPAPAPFAAQSSPVAESPAPAPFAAQSSPIAESPAPAPFAAPIPEETQDEQSSFSPAAGPASDAAAPLTGWEDDSTASAPVEEPAVPGPVATASAPAPVAPLSAAQFGEAAPQPEAIVAQPSSEAWSTGTPPAPATSPAPAPEPVPAPVPPTPQPVDPLTVRPQAPAQLVIALGGNVGGVVPSLRTAVSTLRDTDGIDVTAVAPLARTAAVAADGEEQPDYLNTVVLATTILSPREVLAVCQDLEAAAGRVRTRPQGPRTLDADIITYEGVTSADPELTLPHPRAAQRAFVLTPWAQADPFAEIGDQSVAALAEAAPDADGVRWLALDWLDSDHLPALPTGQYVAPPDPDEAADAEADAAPPEPVRPAPQPESPQQIQPGSAPQPEPGQGFARHAAEPPYAAPAAPQSEPPAPQVPPSGSDADGADPDNSEWTAPPNWNDVIGRNGQGL